VAAKKPESAIEITRSTDRQTAKTGELSIGGGGNPHVLNWTDARTKKRKRRRGLSGSILSRYGDLHPDQRKKGRQRNMSVKSLRLTPLDRTAWPRHPKLRPQRSKKNGVREGRISWSPLETIRRNGNKRNARPHRCNCRLDEKE